jgi:hypothetical protein
MPKNPKVATPTPATIAEAVEELMWKLDDEADEQEILAKHFAEDPDCATEATQYRNRAAARRWLVKLIEASAVPPATT